VFLVLSKCFKHVSRDAHGRCGGVHQFNQCDCWGAGCVMSKAVTKTKKLIFSKKAEAEFKDILKRYPDKRSCIMATLYLAQTEFGWMSPQVMEFVALKLEVPISQVVIRAQ
jgi:NADH:ubiquinone oxidoreductase subunit E